MSVRQERVRELLKRQVGVVLRREYSVEEVGVISVNDVGVSGDLHSATVFVGVIGTPEQRKKAIRELRKDSKRLQTLVGQEVILKYTPTLRFVADDAITHGNKVLAIMEELEKANPQPPQQESDDEADAQNH
jgi:ribosome-binding factor A